MTIHEAAATIGDGRLSPPDLLEQCLERIDRHEERVRAWVLVDRDGARAEAKRLADELRRGRRRGPLHGIPVGIKDLFDVFDWPTAAGSLRWKDAVARQDATVVRRLRDAGAVLVGKTVTTQYASFDPPPTRNPWKADRTPGGSSSGSAAAVACGMCLGALGSQTGGSIARPAAFCGVAGIKPTYGRVSVHGVVPLAHSMDHVGAIARTVADLAVLLQSIAGPDPLDPTASRRPISDFLEAITRQRRPPRLGRLHGLFDDRADSATRRMIDRAAEEFRLAGASVVDVPVPAAFAEVTERHHTVMAVEAARFHEARLRRWPNDYEPNIRRLIETGLACSAMDYARCKEHQRRLSREMRACFVGVAALLTPAAPGPAPDAATTGDPVFNSPWSYTGLPTVCFATGRDADGMPLGIQLVGRRWGEADLLAAAAWCERRVGIALGEPPTG
jgi:aspartyl-tRNA(Asn)/glutamyl-tRNA(Gln) amidotransferase subunit A